MKISLPLQYPSQYPSQHSSLQKTSRSPDREALAHEPAAAKVIVQADRSDATSLKPAKPNLLLDALDATTQAFSSLSNQMLPKQMPNQQKAIELYNITALMNFQGGDGELIGVDTYA